MGDGIHLPKGMMDYGQSVASYSQYAQDNNLSPEQIKAGMEKIAKGDLPEGANITKAIVEGYTDGVLIAGAWHIGPAATVGEVVTGSTIAAIANGSYQWYDLSRPGNENESWDYRSSISAVVSGGLAPGRKIWSNTGIAIGSAIFTDGMDAEAIGGAVTGALAGGVIGEYAPNLLRPIFGSSTGIWVELGGAYISEVAGNKAEDAINRAGDKK